MIRNRSIRKILNKIEPSVDPCGTTKRISSQELYEVLVLVLCLPLVGKLVTAQFKRRL